MRVFQRGARGIWWVDFTVPGGARYVRSSGTTDEAAAKEWAATAYRDQWRQHRLGEAPSHTWDEAVVSWLAEHQHLRSIEEARRNLRWLAPRLTGKPLASITADVVRRLSSERQAEPSNLREIEISKAAGEKPPAPRMLSPATVNRYLSDLFIAAPCAAAAAARCPAGPATIPRRRAGWPARPARRQSAPTASW